MYRDVYRLRYYPALGLREATAKWCADGAGIPFANEIPTGTVICNLPEYWRRYERVCKRGSAG